MRAADAQILSIFRGGAGKATKATRWPSVAVQTARAKEIARKLGITPPLRVRAATLGSPKSFSVAHLVYGHRVFVGPFANGAVLVLDAQGRLRIYERHDHPVTCPPPAAILPAAEALRRFRDGYKGRLVRFKPKRPPEIIYYSSDGQPATLAWYVPAEIGIDTGYSIRGSDASVVVDATNGRAIRLPIQFSDPI